MGRPAHKHDQLMILKNSLKAVDFQTPAHFFLLFQYTKSELTSYLELKSDNSVRLTYFLHIFFVIELFFFQGCSQFVYYFIKLFDQQPKKIQENKNGLVMTLVKK